MVEATISLGPGKSRKVSKYPEIRLSPLVRPFSEYWMMVRLQAFLHNGDIPGPTPRGVYQNRLLLRLLIKIGVPKPPDERFQSWYFQSMSTVTGSQWDTHPKTHRLRHRGSGRAPAREEGRVKTTEAVQATWGVLDYPAKYQTG